MWLLGLCLNSQTSESTFLSPGGKTASLVKGTEPPEDSPFMPKVVLA